MNRAQLLKAIKKYPEIWDSNNKLHLCRSVTSPMWNEIAEQFGGHVPTGECKRERERACASKVSSGRLQQPAICCCFQFFALRALSVCLSFFAALSLRSLHACVYK